MEFRNDCDVYRDRSVRASWKVPAFCCNDWGALKLLEICSAFGFERPFDLVYGAPHCSWSGGRPSAVRSPLDGGLIDAYFSAYVTIAALLLHRSTLHCYSAPWQTATP